MQFSPVAIGLVVIGALSVIIGIKGSNRAVFQTLTGHSTGTGTGVPSQGGSPLTGGNPMVAPGSGSSVPIGAKGIIEGYA